MAARTLWFVIALDFIGFLIIWFEIHRYREGRRRGETAATTFMWFGFNFILSYCIQMGCTWYTWMSSWQVLV